MPEHKRWRGDDGRRDYTAMPVIGGDFAVLPGTLGWLEKSYCHAGTQKREGRLCCHTRDTRMARENSLPCQEHKRGRGDFAVVPGTQG